MLEDRDQNQIAEYNDSNLGESKRFKTEAPFCVVTYTNGKSHLGRICYATPRGIEFFSL
jgi:hypothetical protein